MSTGASAAGTLTVLERDIGTAAMIAVTALLNTCGTRDGDIHLKTFLHSFLASLTAGSAVDAATVATPAAAGDLCTGCSWHVAIHISRTMNA